jgi:hypothetical protein
MIRLEDIKRLSVRERVRLVTRWGLQNRRV